MAWPKGKPRPAGAGRKKGTLNKRTVEIQERSRELLESEEYQNSLLERVVAGKATHMEPILHYYAYGKPPETVRMGGENGGPVGIKVTVLHVEKKLPGKE